MFNKVLAATDVLGASAPVLTAAEIAKQSNGALHIIHVLESAYSGKYRHYVKHFETGEEIVSSVEYETKVKERIAKECAEILKSLPVHEIRVTAGLPWEQILKCARDEDVNLIVLGPHSQRAEVKGVARVAGTVGTTVEGVVTHEHCPVMIVNRPILRESLTFDRILVCIDFSESCKYALQFAVKMAQKCGSKLFIFHVFPVPSSDKYPQGELELELYGLKKELKTFCKNIPDGVKTEFKVWEGTLPYLEIVKYARENQVDLIVMGSHTKEKGDKWYVGSAVEQVSARSVCPVAVFTDPKVLLKIGGWQITGAGDKVGHDRRVHTS